MTPSRIQQLLATLTMEKKHHPEHYLIQVSSVPDRIVKQLQSMLTRDFIRLLLHSASIYERATDDTELM
jgi:uncharacterized protein (DUF2336 family)